MCMHFRIFFSVPSMRSKVQNCSLMINLNDHETIDNFEDIYKPQAFFKQTVRYFVIESSLQNLCHGILDTNICI